MKIKATHSKGITFTSVINGIETGSVNGTKYINIYTPDKIMELSENKTTFTSLIIKTAKHEFKFNIDIEIIQGPNLNSSSFANKEMNFKMLSDTLTTIYFEMED